MNPLMIMAAIGVGAIGVTMLLKKSNAATRWVQRFWQGLEEWPEGFRRTPESVATTILENSASSQILSSGTVEVRCLGGTQVYAADDGVIVSMNPIPGSLAQTIGLAHLSRREESSLYVGVMPDVGIGQLVLRGGTIGSTETQTFFFSVRQRLIPIGTAPTIGLRWWFEHYNVRLSPERLV